MADCDLLYLVTWGVVGLFSTYVDWLLAVVTILNYFEKKEGLSLISQFLQPVLQSLYIPGFQWFPLLANSTSSIENMQRAGVLLFRPSQPESLEAVFPQQELYPCCCSVAWFIFRNCCIVSCITTTWWTVLASVVDTSAGKSDLSLMV